VRPPARKRLSSAEVALLQFLTPKRRRKRKRGAAAAKDVQAAA
jgi:hypothetical protein